MRLLDDRDGRDGGVMRYFVMMSDAGRVVAIFAMGDVGCKLGELRWDANRRVWTDISPALAGWLVEGRTDLVEVSFSELNAVVPGPVHCPG